MVIIRAARYIKNKNKDIDFEKDSKTLALKNKKYEMKNLDFSADFKYLYD